MSKVSKVSVRVPIEEAVAWDPWLTTELGVQADRLGLGYDGGEQNGSFEAFDFSGDPAQVEKAVVLVLGAHEVHRAVTRKGRKVTVAGVLGRWLVPLAPQETIYEKALHRIAKELHNDAKLSDWWAGTNLSKIIFHESHEPGRPALVPGKEHQHEGELYVMHFTDLTIVDEDPKPTKAQAEKAARENLREVLEAVAKHLQHPLPY